MIHILPGAGSNPRRSWFYWLRTELENKGYSAQIVKLPFSFNPSPQKWTRSLESVVNPQELNIFVAHSLSCQTIMRYIAETKPKTKGIYLVSPFQNINLSEVFNESSRRMKNFFLPRILRNYLANKITENLDANWCSIPLPFEEFRDYQERTNLFFSYNDNLVSAEQISFFKKKLPRANFKIIPKAGHFSTRDGYNKFQELLDLIISKND